MIHITLGGLIEILLLAWIVKQVFKAAKVLIKVYCPIERRRHLVFSLSPTFSSIYRQPTYVPVSGHFFKSRAERKAEYLAKIGHTVFVHTVFVHKNLGA